MHIPTLSQVIVRAYSYVAIFNNSLIIHAGATVYNKNGILFCGVPGAGKSTQCRLWEQVYRSTPLNNDQPFIFWENGQPMVHGTPWSGKEPCYKNEYYPIKAIVFVEKSPEDRVEKLRPIEAFALLQLNNYLVPVADGVEEKQIAVVEHLAMTVPVYRQYCTKTETAPKTLHKELFG